MRKLGDQWIEIIDGQEHMVKAVEGWCDVCCLGGQEKTTCAHCDSWKECPTIGTMFGVKDLGILRDGRIPCPICGRYPMVYENYSNPSQKTKVSYYHVVCAWKIGRDVDHGVSVFGRTIEDANKRWNRRS